MSHLHLLAVHIVDHGLHHWVLKLRHLETLPILGHLLLIGRYARLVYCRLLVLLVYTLEDWVITLPVLLIHRVLLKVVEALTLTLEGWERRTVKWVHHRIWLLLRVLHVRLRWLYNTRILA